VKSVSIIIDRDKLVSTLQQILPIAPAEEASYIVFVGSDGRYYAKNGLTEQIEYSGTDAYSVIQYALDKVANMGGGRVFIKRGVYVLTNSLRPGSNTVIAGEGPGTVLKLGDGTSIVAIYIENASNIVIDSIAFDGNAPNVGDTQNNTACLGIRSVGNSSNILVVNCFFYNFKSHAIRPDGNTIGFHIYNSVFYNNSFWDIAFCMGGSAAPDGTAYRFPGSVVGCFFRDTSGVELAYTHDVLVMGNYFRNAGIYLDKSKRAVIIGNTFIDDRYGSFTIQASSSSGNNLIIGNRITGTQGTGIRLECSYNLVAYNYISRGWRGIQEVSPADYNYIFNNYVAGHSIANIVKVGTNTIVKDNIGYPTSNSGVATISAGSTRVTVSHGLATTPTKVLITPLGQPPGRLWVENITSTSFDIATDTAPTADLNVAWYAEV
jgi:hypothetical protein